MRILILILILVVSPFLSSFGGGSYNMQFIDNNRSPIAHVEVFFDNETGIFRADEKGKVEIPVAEMEKFDSLEVIALGYENQILAVSKIKKEAPLTLRLSEQPFFMEEHTVEMGKCDELGIGPDKDRRGYDQSYILDHSIGLEMTKEEGFKNQTFTGIDYFLPRASVNYNGNKIGFVIYELKEGKPGEVVYRSPYTDDYKVKWYDFRNNGRWNTFDMKDTVVHVPENGFLLSVKKKHPSIRPRSENEIGPYLAYEAELDEQLVWQNGTKEMVEHKKESNPQIKYIEDKQADNRYWYKTSERSLGIIQIEDRIIHEHDQYPVILLRARYEKCN